MGMHVCILSEYHHRHGKLEVMPDRIATLKSMLESEPNDTFCLYGLAMEYSRLGQFPQAVAWFDQTLTVDPDYLYAYFHKARCQEQAGDTAAAADTLRQGVERAQSADDAKAFNELAAYLDQLT
jgi:tetratricopeptide (TPR) repeat protein